MAGFVPTEEHQILLEKFISQIPAEGVQPRIMSMMPGSKTLKPPFKFEDVDKLQGIVEDNRFYKLTGYTHNALLKKWSDPGNRTTTCNEFCTKCGTAMGYKSEDSKDGVGRFDIADYLTRYGKGHAWVRFDSGAKPDYGDIFRVYESAKDQNGVARNHMGVSLEFDESGRWHTVESGQAGPSQGFDAIERKSYNWPLSGLQGWVSMKLLLGAGKRTEYWLGGWWEVAQEPYETWYYFFDSGRKVYCTNQKPMILSQPPAPGLALLVGTFTMKTAYIVQISWQSADVDEELTSSQQDMKGRKFSMVGKTSRGAKLKAERMMITGLL